MRSRCVKKLQRKINNSIKKLNIALCENSEYQGRFTIRQIQSLVKEYSDHRGAYGVYVLRISDKMTGLYEDDLCIYYDILYGWHMYRFITNFIQQADKLLPYGVPNTKKNWLKDSVLETHRFGIPKQFNGKIHL